MSELQIFKNEEFGAVRAVEIDGEVWFVGKDVAEILGYERVSKALQDHVDETDKKWLDKNTQASFRTEFENQGNGVLGQRGGCLVNESGMYSLIFSSKLPKAKEFKRWVTSEVLPAIRKHGVYATDAVIEKTLTNPDFGIRLLTELKREREQRVAAQAEAEQLTAKVEKDAPKVLFADAVATSKNSILVGQLAKLITQNGCEIGQNRLYTWLRENGYLCKCPKSSNYNLPTQRYMNSGLFEVKVSTSVNPDGSIRTNKTTKVTGKGQLYFINKFLSKEEAAK